MSGRRLGFLCGLASFVAAVAVFGQRVSVPDARTVERQKVEYDARWDRLSDADKKRRNEAVKLAEEANGRLRENDAPAAAGLYDRALQIWPDLLESFVFAGIAYGRAGRCAEAVPLLERYLREYDGRDVRGYRALADCYRKTRRPGQAVAMLQAAASLDRNDQTILLELGEAQFEAGDLAEAEKTLMPLLRTLPAEPNVPLVLAEIAARRKDWTSVERLLLTAEANIRDNEAFLRQSRRLRATAKLAMAADLSVRRRPREALAAAREATVLAPDFGRAFFEFGRLLLEMRSNTAAASALAKAAELDPGSAETRYLLGVAFEATGRNSDALAAYQVAEAGGFRSADLYLRLGRLRLDAGFADEALRLAERGLSLSSGHAGLNILKGVALYEAGEYAKAEESFRTVLAADKNNREAQEYLARTRAMILVQEANAHYDARRWGEAIRKYEEAVRLAPDAEDLRLNLALAYVQTNRLADAFRILLPLRAKNSNAPAVLEALALAYERNNRPDLARPLYERLAAMKKVDPSAYVRLGERAEANGRLDEAESLYRQALGVDREHAAARRRLAIVLMKKAMAAAARNDFEGAGAFLEEARTVDPSNPDIVRRLARTKALRAMAKARAEYTNGNFVAAVTAYSQAVREDAEIPEAFHGLGQAFYDLRDWERAAMALERAVALRRDFVDAYKLLAEVRRRQGRYTDAASVLAAAIALAPQDAELHAARGYVFFLNNDLENAKSSYRQALLLNPRDAETRVNLGLAFFQEGDYASAETEFKSAVGIDPSLDDAYYNLGLVYFRMNRYEDSVDAFRTSIGLNPDVPDKYFALARTLYYMPGRTVEALSNARKAYGMTPAPRYLYALGKIHEKRMEESRRADEEARNRNAAIEAYQAVIRQAPGTQLAVWSEERLRVLLQTVRLLRLYVADAALRVPPLVAAKGGDVFVLSDGGGLYAFSLESTNEEGRVWTARPADRAGVSAVLDGGIIYAAGGNAVCAVRAEDGTALWRVALDGDVTTPMGLSPQGLLLGTADGRALALDRRNGALLAGIRVAGAALVAVEEAQGRLWYTSSDGTVGCVEWPAGTPVWERRSAGRVVAPFLRSAGRVHIVSEDGVVQAWDERTGSPVWRTVLSSPLRVAPVAVDAAGSVVVADRMRLVRLDGQGREVWWTGFPETVTALSRPNGKGNLFVTGGHGGLYCVQTSTGHLVWTYRFDTAVRATPTLAGDDQGFFASSGGAVYHLEFLKQ